MWAKATIKPSSFHLRLKNYSNARDRKMRKAFNLIWSN